MIKIEINKYTRTHIIGWYFLLAMLWPSTGQGEDKIVFTATRDVGGEIYIMDADGSNLVNLTNHPEPDYEPHVAPYGDRIVFMSRRTFPDGMFIMNLDGSGLRRVVDDDGLLNKFRQKDPSLSPDGTKIVFSLFWEDDDIENGLSSRWNIYTVNVDGTDLRRLTEGRQIDIKPVWLPDGQRIAFCSRWRIHTMNADGTDVEQLNIPLDIDSFAWSPTNNELALSAYIEGSDSEEIVLIHADGTNMRILTNNSARDLSPSWSSDGKRLAFDSDRAGKFEIFTINADGTDLKNITNHPTQDTDPQWVSDSPTTLIEFRSWGILKQR